MMMMMMMMTNLMTNLTIIIFTSFASHSSMDIQNLFGTGHCEQANPSHAGIGDAPRGNLAAEIGAPPPAALPAANTTDFAAACHDLALI